ncbi:MAG: YdiK family protein [Bacilli bacterium]
MKKFPFGIVLFYVAIASLFTYFAIDEVQVAGWNWIAFLYIAVAAYDYKVAIVTVQRYFEQKKQSTTPSK